MICPECNAALDLEDVREYANGSYLDCPNCGEELEVVELDGGGIGLQVADDYYDDDLEEDIEW